MIGMGFAKDYKSMSALRVILGVLEAGFFPSCVYLLSTWYVRCKYHYFAVCTREMLIASR